MTKPKINGYHARRALLDNAARIREAERCLDELSHEVSIKGAVLVARALRQLAEIHRTEMAIRTGDYEEDGDGDA